MRRFLGYYARWGTLFLALIGLLLAAMVVFPLVGAFVGAGWSLVALGLLVFVFPFATPETVRWLGLARAILAARVAGALAVGLGAWALGVLRAA